MEDAGNRTWDLRFAGAPGERAYRLRYIAADPSELTHSNFSTGPTERLLLTAPQFFGFRKLVTYII